ncbi:MAG: hypothetical protein ABGX07_16030 [Pirellulaceae bacterium]|jgi:hypothetical protein|nr:hypothetical protein [Planctomycetaceae bacterium]HIM30708.1 hypothetical protein [Planctomycetota bacterium]
MKKIVGLVILVTVLFQFHAMAQPAANDNATQETVQKTAVQNDEPNAGETAQGSPSDLRPGDGVSAVNAAGAKASCKSKCRVRRLFRRRLRCRR